MQVERKMALAPRDSSVELVRVAHDVGDDDVDHGLGGQVRDRRVPDMLDAERHVFDRRPDPLPEMLEELRPSRVVVDDRVRFGGAAHGGGYQRGVRPEHPGARAAYLTMAARTNTPAVAAVITAIGPESWVDIDYTPDGQAQMAECQYWGRRLIVRRTRLTGAFQARLWPDWRHFRFLTDLDDDVASVDAFHRDRRR